MAFDFGDAIKGAFERLQERFTDPFLGTFLFTFALYNWDLIAILVGDMGPWPVLLKTLLIKDLFWGNWYFRMGVPLALTGLAFFIWPFVSRRLLQFREGQLKLTHDALSSIRLRQILKEMELRTAERDKITEVACTDDVFFLFSKAMVPRGTWVVLGLGIVIEYLSVAVEVEKNKTEKEALVSFLLIIARNGGVVLPNQELKTGQKYCLLANGRMTSEESFMKNNSRWSLGTAVSPTEFYIEKEYIRGTPPNFEEDN